MKYDAILYIDPLVNEDDRYSARKSPESSNKGPGIYVDVDDPRMHANNNFGRALQSSINGFGSNYFAEVTDFGKWVVATVGYHDYIAGHTSQKTFLIVFKDKGDGLVMSSSTKWRSISGVDQAISYIRSVCSALQSEAQRKL